LTQWDFTANLEQLLASVERGDGPRSMSSMIQAAAALIQRSRRNNPTGLEGWLNDNADALIGQQILIANVHAQPSPATELPRALHQWAAQGEGRTPAQAVAWLKEEYPGLLRAWLLSRVEDLIGDEMARG
jgi:hypothetical protein